MFRRPLLRTAVVGGVAYAAGHHFATKSAQQQQTDAQQNAQIEDMQQQPPPPPVYQQPAPPPPAAPTGLTDEGIAQLKQLGQLHESGVLTDAEFEAAKQKILGI
jgi:hypothetical protein